LRKEIEFINDKKDYSGVDKKVDTNIEAARKQYKEDQERKKL